MATRGGNSGCGDDCRDPEGLKRTFAGEASVERFAQALPGYSQVFGEDTGFADGGHEVGVTGPAGQGVEVEMSGDAGATGFADIHAKVEAMRLVEALENLLRALGEVN